MRTCFSLWERVFFIRSTKKFSPLNAFHAILEEWEYGEDSHIQTIEQSSMKQKNEKNEYLIQKSGNMVLAGLYMRN
jgi:hypothetical protein